MKRTMLLFCALPALIFYSGGFLAHADDTAARSQGTSFEEAKDKIFEGTKEQVQKTTQGEKTSAAATTGASTAAAAVSQTAAAPALLRARLLLPSLLRLPPERSRR